MNESELATGVEYAMSTGLSGTGRPMYMRIRLLSTERTALRSVWDKENHTRQEVNVLSAEGNMDDSWCVLWDGVLPEEIVSTWQEHSGRKS